MYTVCIIQDDYEDMDDEDEEESPQLKPQANKFKKQVSSRDKEYNPQNRPSEDTDFGEDEARNERSENLKFL